MIGADSLGFLDMKDVVAAVGLPADHLCRGCFNGEYPAESMV
jgi:amidophosphoribosyltransferase